jgi:hypothetical protein
MFVDYAVEIRMCPFGHARERLYHTFSPGNHIVFEKSPKTNPYETLRDRHGNGVRASQTLSRYLFVAHDARQRRVVEERRPAHVAS